MLLGNVINSKGRDMGKRLKTIKLCFGIAIIIFLTSVLSDFSVRMFYSSTDALVQIIAGLIAVLLITLMLALLFVVIPDLRRAFLSVFGMEEE